MALPALALGWSLVAAIPPIKYTADVRVDTVVRTKLLTERTPDPNQRVVSDLLIAPRLDSVMYTNRLEVKFVAEPQIFLRQMPVPTFELLVSAYARADYKLRRNLTLIAVHTTTFGTFPLNDFGGAGGSDLPVAPRVDPSQRTFLDSAYVYTESAVGFASSLGVKRLAVSGTLGWIVNGLLDYAVLPLKRQDASYPQQRYPELRMDANYGVSARDRLTLFVYGRDVSFSTANRDVVLQVAPGIQHKFNPLVQGQLALGVALGRVYPRLGLEPYNVNMPTVEVGLDAPVPIGLHWPVQAKLRARYVPYMDPLSTQLVPRGEVGLALKWEGRRKAIVTGEVRYAHPITAGLHRNDQEVRSEVEALLPLPVSRYLFFQTKGQFMWRQHAVLASRTPVQWFTSVGLVMRYDRGRL
ncbi:MAG: hypothetical protein ABW123_09295 [Cystobacter sp.]